MGQKDFLLKQIEDAALQASERGGRVFFGFYEPAVQLAVEREIARYPQADCLFFGGSEYCERKMLSVFRKGSAPAEGEFPIACVQFAIGEGASHRDVLGALTGLGVEREKVGDIHFKDGLCQFFAPSALAGYFVDSLTGVGSQKVSPKQVELSSAFESEPEFSDLEVVVSSLRIDTILHNAYRLSRSDAADYVKNDKVQINHRPCLKPSALLKEGDVVSVRSKGRLAVGPILATTKKGNYRLRLRKFI
jgi:RNA-binding protein YlmH